MKNIIQGVWNIYLDDWSFFCPSIFDSGNGTIGNPTIKINLLKLVTKYYGEAQVLDLPSSKQIWFKRDINEYQIFSVDSLRRWISISKGIIKTYKNRKVHNHKPQRKKQYYSVGERVRQRSKSDPISNIHEIIEISPSDIIKRKQTDLTKYCINLPSKHNKSPTQCSLSSINN